MFYIVGLGNPGEKYANTRHNIGWLVLDRFLSESQLPRPIESSAYSGWVSEGMLAKEEVVALYPNTFMNNSGSAVVKLVKSHEAQQLVVIHDDIDLPFGEIKVGQGRGPGGNNGVKSIIEKLGSKEFIRIRIGIAPKSFWTGKVKRPVGGGPLERFVLKPFTSGEKKQLPEVCERVVGALQTIVSEGVEDAMNRFN